MLLLERLKQTGTMGVFGTAGSADTLFDYCAAQIFEGLSGPTRELLVRTAVLPQVTVELAQAVSGRADASRVLDEL